jgi:hypothetical protein
VELVRFRSFLLAMVSVLRSVLHRPDVVYLLQRVMALRAGPLEQRSPTCKRPIGRMVPVVIAMYELKGDFFEEIAVSRSEK